MAGGRDGLEHARSSSGSGRASGYTEAGGGVEVGLELELELELMGVKIVDH